MDQTFYFNARMTHSFLRYAENTHISNQKVLVLIDNLRKGLSEEDMLQKQGDTDKLHFAVRKNVKTCCCIMLHVQCLADLAEDSTPYDRFIQDWSNTSAA